MQFSLVSQNKVGNSDPEDVSFMTIGTNHRMNGSFFDKPKSKSTALGHRRCNTRTHHTDVDQTTKSNLISYNENYMSSGDEEKEDDIIPMKEQFSQDIYATLPNPIEH